VLVYIRRLKQREEQPNAHLPLTVGDNALDQRARDRVLRPGGHAQVRDTWTRKTPREASIGVQAGFGGEVPDFLGCLDLPIKRASVAARYRFEPVYYRMYQKLKQNVFYYS
jgi:hypothetical protein